MKITRVETVQIAIPATPSPRKRISLTGPKSASVEAVVVQIHTDSDWIGIGFAPCPIGAASIHRTLEADVAAPLIGENPFDNERLFSQARHRFRGVGFTGLAARAYAAIDMALWDLKAKAAGVPLFRLLGGARPSATYFDIAAGVIGVDVGDALAEARKCIDSGAAGVSIQVGGGDVQQDADRVQQIRDGIGESAWLGVFADGRYDLGTALAMAHFYEEDVGIDWFDSPIPVEDRLGYRRLAERMEVPLACGANLDDRDEFRRILEEGAARVIRPDPSRLGGLTPLLKVAAMAELFHVAMVPCVTPELGIHLACGLPNVPMLESGHGLSRLFVESPTITGGRMIPPDQPGIGVQIEKAAIDKYRVG